MKRASVQRFVRRTFLITSLLLSLGTLVYGYTSVVFYAEQILQHNDARLEAYSASFSEGLDSMQKYNRDTVYNDPCFQLLSLNILSDSQRVKEQFHFGRTMEFRTPPYGITIFSEQATGTVLYKFGSRIASIGDSVSRQYAFFHQLGEAPEKCGWSEDGRWFLSCNNGMTFLIIRYSNAAGSFISGISLQHYLDQQPVPTYSKDSSVILFTEDAVVFGDIIPAISQSALLIASGSHQTLADAIQAGYLVSSKYMEEYGIGVGVVTPLSALTEQVLPHIYYAVLVLFLAIGLMYVLYRFLRKFLVYPVQEIAGISRYIQNENVSGENDTLPGNRYEEYYAIRTGLYDLKNQIAKLEIERANKENEKEHALLQYYQLQTRSHFFLNCLKSLYSMLENGENDRMKSMIISFSNHLRFVFHDNMTTVPLEAELREVNDYYRINQMDASRFLIIRRDVPDELLQCQVPPLVIQTFLENSLKYNSRKGTPMIFQIKVTTVLQEDGEYLQIHCSDNGIGYSQEVLETINQDLTSGFDAYNVGINNLRRRIAIVYKNNCHTAFYNLPSGGACSVIFIPLLHKEDEKYDNSNC